LFALACKKEEKLISYEGLCECYSKSNQTNIDTKFNDCLDFKKISKNHDFQKYQSEVAAIIKKLIVDCPSYQTDFNNIFLNKFENPNPQLMSQKDSLEWCVNSNVEKAKNLSKLAEIAIQENKIDVSMVLIDQSTSLENKNEYTHWIKSYLFQKKRDYKKAIQEFEIINSFSNNSISSSYNSLMIENLKQEESKYNKAGI
jgi:hypothetical protein